MATCYIYSYTIHTTHIYSMHTYILYIQTIETYRHTYTTYCTYILHTYYIHQRSTHTHTHIHTYIHTYRQPFLTTVRDGTPSMLMQWREIHHNFFIDNYSPQEDVDNDDGSCYYHTHDNFFVYGGQGMKNDFGGHDNHHYNNVYAYVGRGLGVCSQLDGHEDYYYNNKLVTTGTDVGSFTCSGAGKTVVYGNEYFTSTGDITECKMTLEKWQSQGQDKNSTVSKIPSDETVIGFGRDVLGM